MPDVPVYPSKHLGGLRRLHGFFACILDPLHQDRRGWYSNSERNDFPHYWIGMKRPSEVRHRKPDPENYIDAQDKLEEARNAPQPLAFFPSSFAASLRASRRHRAKDIEIHQEEGADVERDEIQPCNRHAITAKDWLFGLLIKFVVRFIVLTTTHPMCLVYCLMVTRTYASGGHLHHDFLQSILGVDIDRLTHF